jgi:hypothetical protein
LNTNTPISSAGNGVPITIQDAVVLNAQFLAGTPTLVTTGQWITLTMRVNNSNLSGGSTSLGTHPLSLLQIAGGSGSFNLISGPVPPTQNIIGNGLQDFTFTYSAQGVGTVTFSGYAQGTDANTGIAQASPVTTYPTITIQQAGALASALTISPTLISDTSNMFVYLTVTNTGGTTVNAVAPTLTFSPAVLTQFTLSPSPTNLTPGASTTFVWGFSPSGTGIITFTANTSGVDIVSGLTKTATQKTGTGEVRTPVNLTSALSLFPSPASTSQSVTVVMTVTNTGQTDALSVGPVSQDGSTFLVKGGSGVSVTLLSGPTPAQQNIAGLSSKAFTFVYSANSVGTVFFSGGARGTDSLLLTEKNSVENASNSINLNCT